MDRLDNPYQPGAGTRPPALIGRDDLIDGFGVTLRRALGGRAGKSCLLVGLRGVGKTLLLNRDFFGVRLDRLTPREKDYLRAMAALGPGSRSRALHFMMEGQRRASVRRGRRTPRSRRGAR